MKIRDHFSESLETVFRAKNIKFFDADLDPGWGIFLTLDPGWKNSDPGCLSVIRNTASNRCDIKKERKNKNGTLSSTHLAR
jgi:hypothetical protein